MPMGTRHFLTSHAPPRESNEIMRVLFNLNKDLISMNTTPISLIDLIDLYLSNEDGRRTDRQHKFQDTYVYR